MEWGSMQERTDLVIAATDCLSSILCAGGEFLTMEARQLTDSVAAACLTLMTQGSFHNTLHSASLFESFLGLGSACVSTSWPDGAASNLRAALRQACQSAMDCGDSSLRRVAASAGQLCDTLSHPTVPALYVITRQKEDPPLAQELTVQIEQARADAKAQKERQVEEEQQRKKVKLEKKQAKAASSVSKTNEIKTSAPTIESQAATTDSKTLSSASKDKQVPDSKQVQTKSLPQETRSKSAPTTVPKSEPAAAPKPTRQKLSEPKAGLKDEGSDIDEDFPMIVDAGPDEEDVDDDE